MLFKKILIQTYGYVFHFHLFLRSMSQYEGTWGIKKKTRNKLLNVGASNKININL